MYQSAQTITRVSRWNCWYFVLIGILVAPYLSGCGGGGGGGGGDSSSVVINPATPNFVRAVTGDTEVCLDGDEIADSDSKINEYLWELLSGPEVAITDSAARKICFEAPEVVITDKLKLKLTVSTEGGKKQEREIELNVVNEKQVIPVPRESYFLDEKPANVTCKAPSPPPPAAPAVLKRVYPNISVEGATVMKQPTGDDSAWYVSYWYEKKIRKFASQDDVGDAQVVLDLSADQRAPLGIALHPEFPTNGKLYVHSHSGALKEGVTRLLEYTWSDPLDAFDPDSMRLIMEVDSPHDAPEDRDHPGGTIGFGPDGYLYIGLGDFSKPWMARPVSQETDNLWGSILRIDVDSAEPYAIPTGNPFANGGGRPEIFAWGFRQPWKWSFDTRTGDLWVGDVGWVTSEEIDIVVAGGNYGWPFREGSRKCLNCPVYQTGYVYDPGQMIEPIHDYGREVGKSVTGGYVYRGNGIPELQGIYIFGDFIEGKVFSLQETGEGKYTRALIAQEAIGLVSFAEDNHGEIYALDFNGGGIYKLVKNEVPPESDFPGRLSETGCVNMDDPDGGLPGMIPYTVQVELWSDGAVKSRWMALPDGARISEVPDSGGDLDFPVGSVLVKHFRLFNRLIETRLFMRHKNGEWAGYSYEWNDSETEAFLLVGAKDKDVNGQIWHYPGRAECLQCHTEGAGRTLGPTTRQLNVFLTQGDSIQGQMQMLEKLKLFSFKPDSTLEFASMKNTDTTLEQRARSYLDVNCSGCHRPDGNAGRSTMDLRMMTPGESMNICNVQPIVDNLGNQDARLLKPGEPGNSIILSRIRQKDANRMPPVGSNQIDQEGVALLESWILSMDSCQ